MKHECRVDFRRFPYRPRCTCGWRADVFYPDGYMAFGHWREHKEKAR